MCVKWNILTVVSKKTAAAVFYCLYCIGSYRFWEDKERAVGTRAKEYENAIQWLLEAGLVYKVSLAYHKIPCNDARHML